MLRFSLLWLEKIFKSRNESSAMRLSIAVSFIEVPNNGFIFIDNVIKLFVLTCSLFLSQNLIRISKGISGEWSA